MSLNQLKPRLHRLIQLALLLSAWVCRQALADSITVAETWEDTTTGGIYSGSVDHGTFNASLTVSNLSNLSANAWSNLQVSINSSWLQTGEDVFGEPASFSDFMAEAAAFGGTVSATSATFYFPLRDTNNGLVDAYKMTFSRSGNLLTIAGQTLNPAAVEPPWSIEAYDYLNYSGSETSFGLVAQADCEIVLRDRLSQNQYADLVKPIYLSVTNAISYDAHGKELNLVRVAGAADYEPPVLTAVSPTGPLTTTNDLLTVQVLATDKVDVANVEFYVNGLDYGPGVAMASNIWSLNFALLPGTNLIQSQATDVNGNSSPRNLLAVTFLNPQTNASLITVSEEWLDSLQTDLPAGVLEVSQDVGTLNAALPVAGLQNLANSTWSNLVLTVSFGGLTFSNSLAAANGLTASNAVFYLDPFQQLSVARAGNTLVLAYETGGGTFPFGSAAANPPILANQFRGGSGTIQAQAPFGLTLQDGRNASYYAKVAQAVYLTGTDMATYDPYGNTLNDVQLAGAADYLTPTLTNLVSAGAVTTTNDLWTMDVVATDSFGITNVEFYVNGLDYGAGVAGVSNLWSLNFALLPGTNLIQSQATDAHGNPSPLDSQTVKYVNAQTNASLITVSEEWLDGAQTDGAGNEYDVSQDVGTLNAALPVPGLQSLSASTWSNLVLTVSFGDLTFANSLTAANVLTASNAIFYLNTVSDPNGNWLVDEQLSVTRAGNTLILAAETGNPLYATNDPLIADRYLGVAGAIQDQAPFALSLQDGNTAKNYANVAQTVYLTGTDTVTNDAAGTALNHAQIVGAATFTPPALTSVSPGGTLTTTNALLTVQVRTADSFGVTNVEFYVNGLDYGSGIAGVSNLWSLNFALLPGTNLIQSQAIDVNGNRSALNRLAVTYVNAQTTASLITVAEHWEDSAPTDSAGDVVDVSQDVGTLNAALPVAGLQNLPASTWSNLVLTVSFGDLTFSNTLAAADVVTTSNAIFYLNSISDPNGNPLIDERLSVARIANTLVLAVETGNPLYATNDPLFADYYLDHFGYTAPFQDAWEFDLTLQAGSSSQVYTTVSTNIYITGTDVLSYDANGNELDQVALVGAAQFSAPPPPTLTAVSPAGSGTTTNELLTVQVKATSGLGIANVEFFLNGLDYGSGIAGAANLWSLNFALLPGTNVIQSQATDVNGNPSLTNTLLVIYMNAQTNASLISVAEHWLDTSQTDRDGDVFYVSQDVGTLNAALAVPGLQSLSATTWSNLVLTVSFGNLTFSNSLAAADALTASNAIFYLNPDPNHNSLFVEHLSAARVGNTLVLATETGNPIYTDNNPIIADDYFDYLGYSAPFQDQKPFTLTLQDGSTLGSYASVAQTLYLAGTDTITYDANGLELDNILLAGAADFLPPTLTAVAPAAGTTLTNGLVTVQIRATDNVSVDHVEFFLNGQDFGSGIAGTSNLWTMNFALAVGSNTVQTVAIDTSGNASAMNRLPLVYVNPQTNATVIAFAEDWLESAQTNRLGNQVILAQDTGLLNAALTIAGLQAMPATTWSNLSLTLSFGSFSRTESLSGAEVLTPNQAVFYYTDSADTNATPDVVEQLTVSRVANTLLLAARVGNPTYLTPPDLDFVASNYLGQAGRISEAAFLGLVLVDGSTKNTYASVSQPVFVAGTNTLTQDPHGNNVNHIQLVGAADFIPPTLTAVAPGTGTTLTNGLVTVQVRAMDNIGVDHVEFFLNGQDFGSGLPGLSNLWSMNFALAIGSNTVQTVATDASGNKSATNRLQLVYVYPQTNASVITFAEARQDSGQAGLLGPDFIVTQDTGLLNAALAVSGLHAMSANTWSNLSLTVTFGSFSRTESLLSADVLTPSQAVFYYADPNDLSADPVMVGQLTVSRVVNTLLIAARVGNPTYRTPPDLDFVASNYLGQAGIIRDEAFFGLTLVDGLTSNSYATVAQPVFVTGSNLLTLDPRGSVLNNVQLTGAADFIPPGLTAVSPASSATVTNGLLTVQVKATDNMGVANVEFYFNGQDFGPGIFAGSNLWASSFALAPGTNLIQSVATDWSGNVSATNALAMVYVNPLTNANLIALTEYWQDSAQTDRLGDAFLLSQDTGVLNAALTVPGLRTMSGSTWSNLSLTLTCGNAGNFSFTNSLAAARMLTTNQAVFFFTDPSDYSVTPDAIGQLVVSRVGNTLLLAARMGNPTALNPYEYSSSFGANNYLWSAGPIQGQEPFTLLVQDGITAQAYATVNRPLYINGVNTIGVDNSGDSLNHVQLVGAADYTPPTLTAVTPASSATVTNGLWTVQVSAADNFGVANVEFYFKGQDFGSGILGGSNLWASSFALAPGTNLIQSVATDWSGNISSTNVLTLVYLNPLTNANLITLTEHWQDSAQTDRLGAAVVLSQDTGLLNAALTVPGLQTMAASTWSNLSLTLTCGNAVNFSFSNSLAAARVLTTNQAVFYFADPADSSATPDDIGQLIVARAGNTLLVAARLGNPTALNPYEYSSSFAASNYLGSAGPIQGQQPFTLQVQDGITAQAYATVNRPIFINGSNAFSLNPMGYPLNHLQLTGGADFVPPTNTITAPTSNQQWSNSLFTVTGTAGDNFAVSNVFYSLNGSAWSNAASANQWTNWTAQVTLAPGLNSLKAFAMDTSGNFSVTNAVNLGYIVSGQLQLRTVGLGAITPNYSNAWLQLGQTYSLAAAPARGFKFSGWTLATNWLGGVASNSPNLQFTMTSNLTLLATFTETNRPTLTLSAPAGGQRLPTALATLIGTASDAWEIAGVWYQLNGGAWGLATSTNGYTNWTQTVALLAGTNTLRAYALNWGGNYSPTNQLNVVSSNSFKLYLALTNAPLPARGLNLSLELSPGLNGQVQFSTNLLTWTAFTNFVGSNTSLTVHDPSATNASKRFYRAVVP